MDAPTPSPRSRWRAAAVATDRAIQALADVATSRMDAIEERVRELELRDARREGASSGWARAQPWLSVLVSIIALAWNVID